MSMSAPVDDEIAVRRGRGSPAAGPRDGDPMGRMTAALLRFANTLVKDPAEAEALVTLALSDIRPTGGRGGLPQQADLFRRLRHAYYSVERSRPRRPMRDVMVNSLAQ